jgi:hypothetical protein
MHSKGFTSIWTIVAVLIVLGLGGYVYYQSSYIEDDLPVNSIVSNNEVTYVEEVEDGEVSGIEESEVPEDLPSWPRDKDIRFPKLEGVLNQLIESGDSEGFVEGHPSIEYKGGRVRVVIVLVDESSEVVGGFDVVVERQYENLIQVWVLVSELGELSDEPYVNFVRLPYKAQPAS